MDTATDTSSEANPAQLRTRFITWAWLSAILALFGWIDAGLYFHAWRLAFFISAAVWTAWALLNAVCWWSVRNAR
jgi:hypothetical protein